MDLESKILSKLWDGNIIPQEELLNTTNEKEWAKPKPLYKQKERTKRFNPQSSLFFWW